MAYRSLVGSIDYYSFVQQLEYREQKQTMHKRLCNVNDSALHREKQISADMSHTHCNKSLSRSHLVVDSGSQRPAGTYIRSLLFTMLYRN